MIMIIITVTFRLILSDFSSIYSGATDNQPFTMQMWVYIEEIDDAMPAGTFNIVRKGESTTPDGYEYVVQLIKENTTDGYKIRFQLGDLSNGEEWSIQESSYVDMYDRWTHIVLTWDGTDGSSNPAVGMQIYRNGIAQTVADYDSSSSFDGITLPYGKWQIGRTSTFVSMAAAGMRVSEFALWVNKVLSSAEINVLYQQYSYGRGYGATIESYKLTTGSAIITQPVRLELRERDNRIGSYPKTQDLNGGEKNIGPFDDRNTIDFLSPYATTTIQLQGKGYTTASLGYMAMHPGMLSTKTISVFRDPLIRHNDSIILRDAVGNNIRFKFWRTQFDVIMGNGRREGRNVRIFNSNDSSYIAEQFTNAINDYTGTLYIEAERAVGGYVKLTQQIPGHKGNTPISSYVTGTSQNLSFSGGSPLEVLYPAMIPSGQYADYLNSMYMRTSGKSEFQEDPAPLPATYPYGVMNTGSIQAPGVMRKGVCDSFPLAKTGSLTTAPFNDSDVTLLETRFYMTGTTSVPHFSSPLKSKTQITIDLSVNKKTYLGHNPGDHPMGGPTHGHNWWWKGMGYYNFDLKCWAPVGNGITGLSRTQATNKAIFWPENISRATLGFGTVGGTVIATGSSLLDGNGDPNIVPYTDGYLSSVGRPTTTFGFPRQGRYFATSSCALKMNKYINRPFVFEKAVLTFDAEFKLDSYTGDLNTFTGDPDSDAMDNAFFRTTCVNGFIFYFKPERKCC